MATLAEVKDVQPQWFSRSNKRFFGDLSYRIMHGKVSCKPYLVRSTYGWSDTFGQPKQVQWNINPLSDSLEIMPMVQETFRDIDAVEQWLAVN